MVVVSSARYSAWKIPSPKVYFRYKNNNIKWLNTAEDGQLTIWFKKEKLKFHVIAMKFSPLVSSVVWLTAISRVE